MDKAVKVIRSVAYNARRDEENPLITWREAVETTPGFFQVSRVNFDTKTGDLERNLTERFGDRSVPREEVKKDFESFAYVATHPEYDYPVAEIPEKALTM